MKIFLLHFLLVYCAIAQPDFQNKMKIFEHLKKTTGSARFKILDLDINADNNKDLLIGVDCNSLQPCLHYVFIIKNKTYLQKGTVLLEKNKFEILKKKHQEMSDILFYQKKNNVSGLLIRYEFDGKKYAVKSSIAVSHNIESLLDVSN